MRTPFYRGSDVCLLCYAIDDYDSFRGLKQWRQEFVHYADVKPDKFPFIVVGNKVNLQNKFTQSPILFKTYFYFQNDMAHHCRQVPYDEVKQWCEQNNINSQIETSSKTATNVTDAFVLAVRQWKHMERIAEIELKQNDTIDLTKTIKLAHSRFCCTGGGSSSTSSSSAAGGIDSEEESMNISSPRRFGKRQQKGGGPPSTQFQL